MQALSCFPASPAVHLGFSPRSCWHPCSFSRVRTLEGFVSPLGVAVYEGMCGDGTTSTVVYVGDDADGSVRVFENGAPAGALGVGSGEFTKPNAIAVTQDQTVYVVDRGTLCAGGCSMSSDVRRFISFSPGKTL